MNTCFTFPVFLDMDIELKEVVKMISNQIKEYVQAHLPKKEDWILDLEKKAKDENIPIMDSVAIDFFLQLIRLHRPKRILEIGTAIGYSALRMHHAYPESKIMTIEKDEKRYKEAIENVNKQGLQNSIQVVHGDAIEILQELPNDDELFHCIFIDAAKGQYKRFFELVSPLIAEHGFIVTDNVLFRGYVIDNTSVHPRYKKMVQKIKAFNTWLSNHPDYMTTILPIGDGVAVSYRK